MTPEQKVKWAVLIAAAETEGSLLGEVTTENVDALYAQLVEREGHWDAMEEVRQGDAETDLKCEHSRHYESKAVAYKMPDGSWVGWTYWYGGGKHGEPEAIEWMSKAYDLNCREERQLIIKRTFSKPTPANPKAG